MPWHIIDSHYNPMADKPGFKAPWWNLLTFGLYALWAGSEGATYNTWANEEIGKTVVLRDGERPQYP